MIKISVRHFLSAIVVASLLLGSTMLAKAGFSQQEGNPPIYLKSGTIYPEEANSVDILPLQDSSLQSGRPGYYIIQFRGPIEQAWKDELSNLGIEILEYIPDFAFKVRGDTAQMQRAKRLENVNWIGGFQPAYKLSPTLKRDGPQVYRLRIEAGVDANAVANELTTLGVQAMLTGSDTLMVIVEAQLLDQLAIISDVAWIENFTMYELHRVLANDSGGGTIIGANTANSRGYDGSTQIVAVTDTGIGGGTAGTAHADIPAGRVVAIYNWPGVTDSCFSSITNDGSIDVDSGHGSHVAGSVLSDGDANGIGRGPAPAARLVFQSVENYVVTSSLCKSYGYDNGYYLAGLPTNIQDIFTQSYNAGARIHTNSWGSDEAGDYTADSASVDTFVWNHPDMLIDFSAGNAGIDANSNGVIDEGSMGSPATAKNALTIGASENARADNFACDTSLSYTNCAAQGGVNDIFTWGEAWPSDYPVNPIRDDPSAGNAAQMAAFSSRGPVDDTRIKPDVVAPGSWVLSAYSDLYQQGYDSSPNPQNGAYQYDGYGYPYSQGYKYMSGTSMSAPLSAGAAAVVRDYFQKTQGIGASAALIKAALINTAVDLLDENGDGVNDNDYPIPNNHEGWGLINLDAATNGSVQYVENTPGLSTNGTVSYQVNATGGALKVTIVWSDYPSTEAASVNLVNDLDLTVTAPGGTVYNGNVFSGGWSASGGSADRRNNVENVYLQTPAAGTYTIQVRGYNVPQGPQPFALVVTGGTFGTGPTHTPTNTSTATRTATRTNTPTATSTRTNTPIATNTRTNTPIATNTRTNTPTATNTRTNTPIATNTRTNTPIATNTRTNTPTSTATSPITQYCSTGAFSIPDNGSTTNVITISDAYSIGDMNVKLDAAHTYVGDLSFSLTHNGVTVVMVDRPGVPGSTYGCSGDNILATLDDEAASSVENQCGSGTPTINGTFSPNALLSAFDGQSLNGTWTLSVSDAVSSDTGTVNQWCLIPSQGGSSPTPTNTAVSPTPTRTPTRTATPTNTAVSPTPTRTPTATGSCPNASGGYCRTDTESRTWIAGTTNQSITGDDATKNVSLPFSFTFAGTAYSSVNISSNGNIHFGTASNAYSNVTIPNTNNPNAMIAAYWDDLSPAVGGAIYTTVSGTAPNRVFVVEWRDVRRYNAGSNGATFEIQLTEGSNEVWILIQDGVFGSTTYDNGASATCGIENAAGNAGNLYSYNTAMLTSNKVIHFRPQ